MKDKIPFVSILLITFFLWCARIYDFFIGDGTGYVKGINIIPLVLIFSFISIGFCFWVAFAKKKYWLQNFLISLTSTIAVVFILEAVSYVDLKIQSKNSPLIEGPLHSMELNSELGYSPKPNSNHEGIRTKDKEIVYKINYQTDSNSLRITPTDSSVKRTHFAQFFGCSMTFGEGVKSNETIPYYFGKVNSSFKPYNFAYSGYGPHQMLSRLESLKIPNIVKEKDGYGFFIYINDHVNRVIGTMTNFSYNGGNAPYFHKSGNELKHEGLFKNSRKLRNLIYETLLKSNTLKLFKVGYPFKLQKADYELTADIISKSSQLYQEQFHNKNFYVIIYPTKIDSKLIISLLQKRGVKVIDYSKLFNELDSKYSIPFDEHPTPFANEVLINQLSKDLKIKQ